MRIITNMEQSSVNQRIKFLIEQMGISARAFSELINESPTNTQNYIGKRNSMPGADYLEKIIGHFEHVNPIWLVTGKGEPFTGEAPTTPVTVTNKKNKGPVQSSTGSHATNNITNVKLEDCKRDLATSKSENESLREQLASKDALLAAKDAMLAMKDEILTLLRGGHNRPN